ncbi:hypothetical protein [Algibacter agarivorans]
MMILLVLFLSCAKFQKENTQTPNIIFIFADDMIYSAIHALGNNKIKTPNLDQLINQGTPLHMLIKARDIDNDGDLDILLGSNSGVFMDEKKA